MIRHKLKLKHSAINKMEKAKKEALYKTVDALRTDVIQAQVMPFDTGTMQNESTYVTVSEDGTVGKLITDTPYAARLYFHPEYNFQTVNNPNAKGLWLEDYLTGSKKDFCEKNFAKFFKKEAK